MSNIEVVKSTITDEIEALASIARASMINENNALDRVHQLEELLRDAYSIINSDVPLHTQRRGIKGGSISVDKWLIRYDVLMKGE